MKGEKKREKKEGMRGRCAGNDLEDLGGGNKGMSMIKVHCIKV